MSWIKTFFWMTILTLVLMVGGGLLLGQAGLFSTHRRSTSASRRLESMDGAHRR
jgi:hypothetical protein